MRVIDSSVHLKMYKEEKQQNTLNKDLKLDKFIVMPSLDRRVLLKDVAVMWSYFLMFVDTTYLLSCIYICILRQEKKQSILPVNGIILL